MLLAVRHDLANPNPSPNPYPNPNPNLFPTLTPTLLLILTLTLPLLALTRYKTAELAEWCDFHPI